MDASRLDGIGLDPSTTSKSQAPKKAQESAPPPVRSDDSSVAASIDRLERSAELKTLLQELKQSLADLESDAERIRVAREGLGLRPGEDREHYLDAAIRMLLGDRPD